MQGDTCSENAIDLRHIVAVAQNLDDNDFHPDRDVTIDVKNFTDSQMELVEADLEKSQTPEKVQRSMKLLRTVRNQMLTNKYGPDSVIGYKMQKF